MSEQIPRYVWDYEGGLQPLDMTHPPHQQIQHVCRDEDVVKLEAENERLKFEQDYVGDRIEELYYCYLKGFPEKRPERKPDEEECSIIRAELIKLSHTVNVAWFRDFLRQAAERYK